MSVGSFSASLSGMNANQQKLSVIGNNLANINTTAFKASTATFSDLVNQSVGGASNNPMQVGLGVSLGSITPNFSQGSIESTGVNTHVAIQGSGFFVIGPSDERSYTRDGSFSFNADGELVTAGGLRVQGFTSTDPATGLIDTTKPPTPIVVPPGVLRAPVPSTQFSTLTNLNATTAAASTFTASVQIYDSLGVGHVATVTYTKGANPGAWTYKITVPGEEVTGGTAGTPSQIATGTLTFNNVGVLTDVNGSAPADVTITSPTWANGAAAVNFNWDLVDANGSPLLTGYAAPSATSSTTQNGAPAGAISAISINGDGELTATIGAGQTVTIAQLAIANFNNPNGLVKLGDNLFSESQASGLPSIAVAGSGGRGTIIGSALEQSNVDIAQEFTQMILAQRGYQANSKSITVADELLVDTLNLKR